MWLTKIGGASLALPKSIRRTLQDVSDVSLRRVALMTVNTIVEFFDLDADPMTGCKTHPALVRDLATLWRRMEQGKGVENISVIYIDVDKFKTVNDRYSHTTGNLYVQEIAQRLLRSSAPHGQLYRNNQAADEFVVVVPNLKNEGAVMNVALEICQPVCVPWQHDGHVISVELSVGICQSSATLAELQSQASPDQRSNFHMVVVDMAEAGMKQAKLAAGVSDEPAELRIKRGSGRLLAFEHENDNLVREILDRRHFTIHYQPIVDLETGRWDGVEALMRPFEGWQDREWSAPAPSIEAVMKRIEQAEGMQLLWEPFVEQVAEQLKRWNRITGNRQFYVSMNASPGQLGDPHFVETVLTAIRKSRLKGQQFQIEIVERSRFPARVDALGVCRDLQRQGVRIALDDFGVAYSNLERILHLATVLSTVKLDRQYATGRNPYKHPRKNRQKPQAAIAKSMVGLAQLLDCTIVAEGIETPQQARYMKRLGCTKGQGKLFGYPMPAANIDQMLQEQRSS